MKRHAHITAFYLETLLLILVFITIILVLTNIFGLGRAQSAAARELSNAVCLAQNAAEIVSAADTPEAAAALLNTADNARLTEERLEVGYNIDMSPSSRDNPALLVCVVWQPTPEDGLVNCRISVLRSDETIYELETAVYTGEAAA